MHSTEKNLMSRKNFFLAGADDWPPDVTRSFLVTEKKIEESGGIG